MRNAPAVALDRHALPHARRAPRLKSAVLGWPLRAATSWSNSSRDQPASRQMESIDSPARQAAQQIPARCLHAIPSLTRRVIVSRALVHHAFFHHEDDVVHGADVVERVALDGDDVGDLLRLDRAQAVVDLAAAAPLRSVAD